MELEQEQLTDATLEEVRKGAKDQEVAKEGEYFGIVDCYTARVE